MHASHEEDICLLVKVEVSALQKANKHRHGNCWMNREGGRYVWEGKGGLTLPDSLTAGRGEAMPWEKAEAAEKGSGAFSLSPIGSGRSRAEQSVMNSLSEHFLTSCGHLDGS